MTAYGGTGSNYGRWNERVLVRKIQSALQVREKRRDVLKSRLQRKRTPKKLCPESPLRVMTSMLENSLVIRYWQQLHGRVVKPRLILTLTVTEGLIPKRIRQLHQKVASRQNIQ